LQIAEPVAVVLRCTVDFCRRHWDEQSEMLAAEHTVIRYDARGHWESSTSTGDYAEYEDLHQLRGALGSARFTLTGLSL